jgi:hypothetical protein
VFSLVAGGVLLVASLFGADQDADADADIGADGDVDADAGHEGLAHGDLGGFVAVFISLRFWTFFATFFGLTGVVFTVLLDINRLATIVLDVDCHRTFHAEIAITISGQRGNNFRPTFTHQSHSARHREKCGR